MGAIGLAQEIPAAFEETVERVTRVVVPAYESQGAWHQRVRAGLLALLELLDSDPELARLCVVEAPVEAFASERSPCARVHEALVDAIDEGRSQPEAHRALARASAEGVVGVVFAAVYSRLCEREPRPLTELVNPLMNLVVLPFLGPEAARRELTRPAATGLGGPVPVGS